MNLNLKAVRPYRKQLAKLVRQGQASLRFIKSGDGYTLLAERGKSLVALLQRTFPKQTELVAYAISKFGQKPRKLLKVA